MIKLARILMVLLLGTACSLCAALTKTTTTITTSLNPSTYGQAVTFTAVVSPAPPDGETVAFMRGKVVLGTGTLSGGTASFTTSTLGTGTDAIKAEYTSDGTYGGSTSSPVSQGVDDATTTTTLVSSQNPSGSEQPVTFTATVTPEYSGTPTGNVFFYNGSKKLGGVSLSGSVASYTTATLPVGTDTITAVYNGSSSFTGSTSNAVDQAVNSGTFIDSSMTWDGITRYYEVYLPAVLPANPPMVLMLHGTQKTTGDDPEPIITLNWGWQPVADQYGFILVKPASTFNPNSSQWNWNAYFMSAAFGSSEIGTCTVPPATACPDDSGFLGALIQNLTAQYNVNPNMVYVAGFSSGAQMAERVGVELSNLVAAIAPGSGQMEGQQTAPPPVDAPGNAVAPISVQEWHGTKDTELPPCNYGKTSYSGVTFYLDTVDDTFNYWTGPTANACTVFQTTQPLCLNDEPNNANDAPTPGMPGLTGNIATGCTDNVTVQFIWEPDVAHSWQTQYDTARWQFFAANPMPAGRKK
ncbi:MAG: Ig-like domain repeat protein [Terriglobales bacterium]